MKCDHALWARAFWMYASLAWVLGESLIPLPRSVQPGAFDTDQTSTEQTCGRTDQNGKKYKDRETSIWVRERTTVRYKNNEMVPAHQPPQRRQMDIECVTTWRPYDKKRWQGRPAKRRRDDLDKCWSDTIWQRTAQDRLTWRGHAEAFAQPRDTTAAQWWWWWLAPARLSGLWCCCRSRVIGSLKRWSSPLWRASGIVYDPWHLEACTWYTGERNMYAMCPAAWKTGLYIQM